MGYCKQIALPAQEPVSLAQAKIFLGLPSAVTTWDSMISGFIQGAREEGERISSRVLAQRQYDQVLDSFPFFTDTIQSQLAFPPSYYSQPRYSTTLWNYSQMIKLEVSPGISIDNFVYVDPNGNAQTLAEWDQFIFDPVTEPARIFPFPNQYWPPCQYTQNAVKITFTAGYDPNPTATRTLVPPSPPPNPLDQQPQYQIVTGIPQKFVAGILNLVAYWFNNRGNAGEVPDFIARGFMNNGVIDFSPTRG